MSREVCRNAQKEVCVSLSSARDNKLLNEGGGHLFINANPKSRWQYEKFLLVDLAMPFVETLVTSSVKLLTQWQQHHPTRLEETLQ